MTAPLAKLTTTCCIAGGGPAGMMLGLLLARAGVEVVVLEKHADFLRDFRGDTIHPSTLELMWELGLLERFLALPHYKVERLSGSFGDTSFAADFTHLPTHCRFVAFMPQWDFLNFLAAEAQRYPTFQLKMQHAATGLIEEAGRVRGCRVATPGGAIDITAELMVAADGRGSAMRDAAGLAPQAFGSPIDVLWFRLERRADDPNQLLGRFDEGAGIVLLNRGDYWQCGFIIAKNGFDTLRGADIDAFRDLVARLSGFDRARMQAIASFDEVKLLSVRVDRLPRWHKPGFLCIGDAAHAMSPVGGVGVNLAIQDAVATANLLHRDLRAGNVSETALGAIQARRDWPTRAMQRFQIAVQNYLAGNVLGRPGRPKAPLPV